MEGMNEEERKAYQDRHMWDWMQETDKLRKAVQSDINEMSRKLHEDLRNRKVEQERLALILSRISPASAYQIAAMNLANTDIHVKSRFEAALEDYQTVLSDYTEKKQKESPGSHGGIQIQFDSETGIRVNTGRNQNKLNVSDMPHFEAIKPDFKKSFLKTGIDIGLLLFYSIMALAGTFVAFLRYDVR